MMLMHLPFANSQESEVNHAEIKEDLNEIVTDLGQHYIYLNEKNVDLSCIIKYYEKQIPNIKNEEQTVLFFENLLNEFYDSHLTLNTHRRSSFRLYAPIHVILESGKPIISNVWHNQLKNLEQNILGAEVLEINGRSLLKVIGDFPTHCNNKDLKVVKEWIANKILAGRYSQPKKLTLKLVNGKTIEFDLDELEIKQNTELLSVERKGNIGVIRINNSLGNSNLISAFDRALDELMDTEGLIIDLRNTVDGGDSYIARGIMGRFIKTTKAYQKHWTIEQYDKSPEIIRSWVEYVSPRKEQYSKPLVVLVGRWTGSMGEGMAIGFDAMKRAEIVGSEMEKLAGEINGFSFKHQRFGYRLSVAKLFHINGTLREEFVPEHYVTETTITVDEAFERGMELFDGAGR
jgi:carboxyl-terminal processing protease